MRTTESRFRGALLTCVCTILTTSAQATAFPSECDEACLREMANNFVEAVAARDASLLPWNGYARFTMNGIELPFSEALWATGGVVWERYRIVIPDVEAGQVALISTMELDATPVMMAARLKVEWGRLSEVETIVNTQSADSVSRYADLDTPDPLFAERIPESQRHSRQHLVALANLYFEAIEGDSGDIAPFDDRCVRVESGAVTAGRAHRPNLPASNTQPEGDRGVMGCREQLNTGMFAYITSIDPRRYEVVDPSRGLVFSLVRFNEDGTLRQIRLNDGRFIDARVTAPVSVLVAELFKIVDGKLLRIEAVGERVHYRAPVGWD